jgi:sodium-coupled neutral amino acid transporter 11
MAAYTVIIGDTVPIVIRALFGVAGDTTEELSFFLKVLTDRRIVIILSSYLIILPISSVRDISSLAKFSIFALIAIILIAISIIISGSYIDPVFKGTSTVLFTFIKFPGVPGAMGTLSFAYVCHHNTFIIYKSLQYPTFKNFNLVNLYSLTYASLASLTIGMTGYIIFLEKVKSNVLNCFSNTDGLINFARGLFALDMFITYPLELYIARNTILTSFFNSTYPDYAYTVITVGLVTMTTVIGISTCNLGLVLDLTGGVAASAIAFIFPAACAIELAGGYRYRRDNWVYLGCIGF